MTTDVRGRDAAGIDGGLSCGDSRDSTPDSNNP
ncbi:MAG: hypothetical protein JWQ60_1472, partial [Pseudonocardia sp.]|nr:hypothetical protein [Pseudonocardia sp.]